MKLLLAYIKQLPDALRMQIFVRLGSGAASLLLFLVVWLISGEFAFALPCLILAVFLLMNSWSLFRTVIVGDYRERFSVGRPDCCRGFVRL